jgi:hypothetical protein
MVLETAHTKAWNAYHKLISASNSQTKGLI